MPKQWDKQSENGAYMYLQNGMYLKLEKIIEGEWFAGVMLRTSGLQVEIMSWEWENIASIESAKDLAYSKLKLWLQELAESV